MTSQQQNNYPLLFSTAAVAASALLFVRRRWMCRARVEVQILCTNDTHSKMEKMIVNGKSVGGVLRRERVFRDMRAQIPETLVLDAGDHFTGSNYFHFYQGVAEMTVLRLLGYDASALGNHDFDANKAGEYGFRRFNTVWRKHAKNCQMLCANVVDATTKAPVLPGFTVFVRRGVKIGVAAVLGPGAWDVTAKHLRRGLEYVDFMEAAADCAESLRARGCQVLVCLSHTGVSRGDRELAASGLFDVVFSGHEHHYAASESLEALGATTAVVGPGQGRRGERLGLLSPGIANGRGVCWAALTVDRERGNVVGHRAGMRLLDDQIPEDTTSEVARHVTRWRKEFEATYSRVVGRCVKESTGVDLKKLSSYNNGSPQHTMVARIVRAEMLDRYGLDASATIPAPIVVLNQYAFSRGYTWHKGSVTLGQIQEFSPWTGDYVLVKLKGSFLRAIVTRNERWIFLSDFLFLDGLNVVYEQVHAGKVAASPPTDISGDLVDPNGWYTVIIGAYQLDTTLSQIPEREGGIRRPYKPRVATRRSVCAMFRTYLERGGELG